MLEPRREGKPYGKKGWHSTSKAEKSYAYPVMGQERTAVSSEKLEKREDIEKSRKGG